MNSVVKCRQTDAQTSRQTEPSDTIAEFSQLYEGAKNATALVVATKEIGLEVNADKTKYMVMSQDRNAGRVCSVKIDNSSFERVEEFK